MLTQAAILREWALSPEFGEDLANPRAKSRLTGIFGHRDVRYRMWVANAALESTPSLHHRANHGWTWAGLDSRHIAVYAAGAPGYFWVGVENRYNDWASLPTPVAADDVVPVLKAWGLGNARWYWAEQPRVVGCPWVVQGQLLKALCGYPTWWYAALRPEGNIYVSVSAQPWTSMAAYRGCDSIVAMGARSQKNIDKTYAKLQGLNVKGDHLYEGSTRVLSECYRAGASWVRRVVLREAKPLDPTVELYEENYARKRKLKRAESEARVG